ncbi:TRAP transporter small permease subunit [Desulfonatronovibrio hydrogenovorans]|uniref:TRAP transporter small permease subunit n=1 Tax=Desulfonatronovibrio hydrogenovorans TaxID=53245 RepID=UPI00048EFC21|nr:TRAP transporter small permease [Desulfonatronovibrio hydrogenovorans]
MSRLEKFIFAMTRKTSQVAQAALVLVMLVIVANIIMRSWWKPLPGSYELVELLGAVILSMGAAYCAMTRGHVTVSLLVDKLPKTGQAIVDLFTSLVSFIFISAIGWGLIKYGTMVSKRSLETSTLGIPLYPFYYLVAIGLMMLALTALLELLKSVLILIGKRNIK